METVAVVLAAGGSRRFGGPKQLAVIDGATLLHRAITAALSSRCDGTAVVLGADRGRIEPALAGMPVEIVSNPGWEEGMASSIRAGVEAVRRDQPPVEALLLMTCDQPRISASVIDSLLEAAERKGISLAACEYAGGPGVPALFCREHFPELLELQGDRGARAVLRRHAGRIALVPWRDGVLDIDTPEDLEDYRDRRRRR
jgi:molybdenum cofactor cytidylyltransferase